MCDEPQREVLTATPSPVPVKVTGFKEKFVQYAKLNGIQAATPNVAAAI